MTDAHSLRLKNFLSTNDGVPQGLARDIKALLEENTNLKQFIGFPARWEKMLDYFYVNEIDVVLHLHARFGQNYWTCMLWSKTSAWAEDDTPEGAMEKAFLKLKNVPREE